MNTDGERSVLAKGHTNSFVDALIVPQAAYSSTALCITIDSVRQNMDTFGERSSLFQASSSESDGFDQGLDQRKQLTYACA